MLAWGLGDTWPDLQLSCSSEEGLIGSLPTGSLGCPRTLPSHDPSMTKTWRPGASRGLALGPAPQPRDPLPRGSSLLSQWRAALKKGSASERAGGQDYTQPCHTGHNHTASRLLKDLPQTSSVEMRWEGGQARSLLPPHHQRPPGCASSSELQGQALDNPQASLRMALITLQ